MKATSLDEVLIYFNRQERLTGEQLKYWFVEREHTPRPQIRRWLNAQPHPQKLLFIGHRGSGKSTELSKLATEMSDRFISIGFDVLELTGRPNLEYEDLMLMLLTRITHKCYEQGIIDRPLLEPVRDKWQEFQNWWQRMVAGLHFVGAGEGRTMGARLNLQLVQLELGIRQSADIRESIKREVGSRIPELIDYLNWVIEQVEAATKQRLLVIIEGLDKVNLEAAKKLFLDNSAALTAPKAHIIFTCPSALLYAPDFHQIRQPFSETFVLPNIAPLTGSDKPNKQGQMTLHQLVSNRIELHLIDTRALNRVLTASGGVPTSLVRLIQNAAMVAEGATISIQDIHNAIRAEREFMTPLLTETDWQILRQRYADRRLTADDETQILLYKGVLVEYRNHNDGQPWCNAHPILWDVLKKQVVEQTDEQVDP